MKTRTHKDASQEPDQATRRYMQRPRTRGGAAHHQDRTCGKALASIASESHARCNTATPKRAMTQGSHQKRMRRRSILNGGRPSEWYECTDILELLFHHFGVSLLDILHCRLVCKIWYQTLGSAESIRRRFCCHTADNKPDNLYWIRLEKAEEHVCPKLTSDQTITRWKHSFQYGSNDMPYLYQIAASSHGLICIQALEDSRLIVYNPATQNHRVLPKPNRIGEFIAVGMRFNPFDRSYTILGIGDKIVYTGEACYSLHVVVYNSKARRWAYHSECTTDSGVQKGKITWWKDRFYWIIRKPSKHSKVCVQLLAYDMQQRTWLDLYMLPPPKMFGMSSNVPDLFVWKDMLVSKFSCLTSTAKYWGVELQPPRWIPLWTRPTSAKPKRLHVAVHLAQRVTDRGKLQVCLFDPFPMAPTESALVSRQSYHVHTKAAVPGNRFPFTPCLSCGV